MKKLKLSLQNVEGAEVLSREQLKKVMGGDYDPGSGTGIPVCSEECVPYALPSGCPDGYACGMKDCMEPYMNSVHQIEYRLSKAVMCIKQS